MSTLTKEEIDLIKKRLGRKPNDLELGIFSVMWSEHCSYRTSKPFLRKFFSDSKRKLVSEGENAGALLVDDEYFVAFKMESHNHPSAIEPYNGAATGVGGILRDIFTMGARPVACGDPLYFGPLKDNRNKFLLKNVVKGISDYGNSVGVPTIGGETRFDQSYGVNCLVNVFALGIGKRNNIITGKAKGIGNIVLYFGSRTGRDGVHGATFASVELSEKSKEDRPSVQIGNPFEEKKLIEAVMELAEKKLVVAMQDMGAAGLTSSSVEMAERGGVGVELDLSKVPLREKDISFYEMMLSETQERMLAIIEPKKLKEVLKVLEKNEVEYAIIGKIIREKIIRLKDGRKIIGKIPLNALLEDIPPKNNKIIEKNNEKQVKYPLEKLKKRNIIRDFIKLLSDDNINDKSWIYTQYDYRVGDDTIKEPGDGFAILRVKKSDNFLAISFNGMEHLNALNAYKGGYHTFLRTYLEQMIAGFEPIGITDCLNFGNPENPAVLGDFKLGTKGLNEACKSFKVPIISGNVSFYNESHLGAIKPVIEIGMVGVSKGLKGFINNSLTEENSLLYEINLIKKQLFPSYYAKSVLNIEHGIIPQANEKKIKDFVRKYKKFKSKILSARIQSRGGSLITAFKMGLEKNIQIKVIKKDVKSLFSESTGTILIQIKDKNKDEFLQIFGEFKPILFARIKKDDKPLFTLNNQEIYKKAKKVYKNSFKEHLNET